jgi:TolB-like protein
MDVQFGPYRLNLRERKVAGPSGPVELSGRSFDILVLLLGRANEVVGKDEIFSAVWPGVVVEENTLQVHISALRKALGARLIATVHGRGYKFTGSASPGSPAGKDAAAADRKPVIAVLPFGNLSRDPAEQYFSDGITEDIIDRLTRFRMISVAGRHASAGLGETADEPLKAGEVLGADYVVTGNVRRSATRIRIAARLTDCRTGGAVWAQSYDRPVEDIFAVQDEVAALVASTLVGRVEAEAATRQPAESRNLTSYDLVLRGIWHFKKLTVADNERAAELFREALELNPANAEALRWLASHYINRWFIGHDRQELHRSVELGKRAAELDPASARCHSAHAFPLIWAEGCDAASAVYRKAVQANPDDPHILAEMALVEFYRGNPRAGHALMDEAERRNPLPPLWYAEFRAIGLFAEGLYAEALPALAAIPECVFDTAYAVSCLGHLGRTGDLTGLMERVRTSGWDLEAVAVDEPFADPLVRERLLDGLERASAIAPRG